METLEEGLLNQLLILFWEWRYNQGYCHFEASLLLVILSKTYPRINSSKFLWSHFSNFSNISKSYNSIYSRQINFFQKNLHFLVCEFGWWLHTNRYFQSIRMLILQYIKVKHHPSPPRPHQFSPTVSLTSVSEQTLWTGSFVLRIFLKTEQQKGSWLFVSLKQVSRNIIPAVSPIHHLLQWHTHQ